MTAGRFMMIDASKWDAFLNIIRRYLCCVSAVRECADSIEDVCLSKAALIYSLPTTVCFEQRCGD